MRIVVRSPDARAARAAQSLLAQAGVEALAIPGAAVAPDGEDIAIIPCSDARDAAAQAFAAGFGGRLALLAGVDYTKPPALGLEPLGAFTGAVALDAPPALLAAQLAAVARHSIASDECARRRVTAEALGAGGPTPLEPRPLKALYFGAPSPKYLRLESTFAALGGHVTAAFTSFAGFDHLHDEPFDAAVLNGVSDPAKAISFCAALRRNTSLFHLPTLVITAPGDEATGRAAIDRGASAVTALNASATPGLGWLFEAIRRERGRKATVHDLQALRDIMGDARTGLFRRAPFETHLVRLANDHHSSGRHFALAVLRVLPAHGARTPSAEVWKRGFDEIGNLASRLMRDGDCGAAIDGDVIVLALPATDLGGAKRAALRVSSVAECTAFASGEGGAGPLVFEQSVVELQPGESGMGLLARALRGIELESIPA